MADAAPQVPPAAPAVAPPMPPPVEGVTRTVRGPSGSESRGAVSPTNGNRLAAAAEMFAEAQAKAAEPPPKAEPEAPPEPAPSPAPQPKAEAQPAAPAEKPADKPKEDPQVAQRLALVTEKERRLLAQQRAKEAAFAEREAALAKQAQEFKEWQALKARAKDDPKAWLEAGGLTFETAAKQQIELLKKPAPTAEEREAALREQIRKEMREEFEKTLTEREQKALEQSRGAQEAQARTYVANQILAAPEKYPAIIAERQESEVFELMKGVYLNGASKLGFAKGTQLPFDKAAEIIENAVREDQAKRFGPHADRVKEFYASFAGKPADAPKPGSETGKSLPASTDAGKGAEKPKTVRGKERDPGGRFSKTISTGNPSATAAGSDDEMREDESFDEYRERRKRKLFGG